MKIITGSRASGKTYTLVKELLASTKYAIMVCPHQGALDQARNIARSQLRDQGYSTVDADAKATRQIITADQALVRRGIGSGVPAPIFVDGGLEWLVHRMLQRTGPVTVAEDAPLDVRTLSVPVDNPHLKKSVRYPRGTCPTCGRSVALRGDNELRDHQGRSERLDTPGRPWAWCPGSGTKLPVVP